MKKTKTKPVIKIQDDDGEPEVDPDVPMPNWKRQKNLMEIQKLKVCKTIKLKICIFNSIFSCVIFSTVL